MIQQSREQRFLAFNSQEILNCILRVYSLLSESI